MNNNLRITVINIIKTINKGDEKNNFMEELE